MKRYQCDYCSDSFITIQARARHEAAHRANRPMLSWRTISLVWALAVIVMVLISLEW